MKIYALLDRKLKEYSGLSLALARNDEAIKRAMRDGIPGSRSVVEQHPDDFDVMLLGEFDADTGVIVPQVPQLVGNVKALLPPAGGGS